MPRIYTSKGDPLDFCRRCFPLRSEAERLYGNIGDHPLIQQNMFGYNHPHPQYSENSGCRCQACNRLLTYADD